MPQLCTVCRHERRDEVDRALVTGTDSNRRIAARFEVSETALRRHKAAHLPSLMQLAQHETETAQHVDLVALVRRLVGDAHRIRERAEKEGDLRTALAGIRELVRLLELAVRTGEAQSETQQGRFVKVVWDMGGDEVTPEEARAIHRAAERRGELPVNGQTDITPRPQPPAKTLVKRRQYRGY